MGVIIHNACRHNIMIVVYRLQTSLKEDVLIKLIVVESFIYTTNKLSYALIISVY